MISKEYKVVFIHIPKNAGTSICNFLQEKQTGICVQPKIHSDINDIKNKFPQAYKNYRKFAVVRNPYDRMVSWFSYLKESAENSDFDMSLMYPTEFSKWIEDPFKYWLPHEKLNIDENGKYSLHFLEHQYTWVDETVTILKYENLKEELIDFLGEQVDLPIMNKSKRDEYIDYYNRKSLDIVYNRYEEDFKKYNYKKL